MMSVGLHARISGHPARALALARFLDYVQHHADATAAGTLDPTGDKAGEGAAVSLRLPVTVGTRCGKTLADPTNPLVRRGARRVGHRLSTEAATADVDSFRQRQGTDRA